MKTLLTLVVAICSAIVGGHIGLFSPFIIAALIIAFFAGAGVHTMYDLLSDWLGW